MKPARKIVTAPVGFVTGLLIVTKDLGHPNGASLVLAKCQCGSEKQYRASNLLSGQRSCGCATAATISVAKTRHGMSRSVEFGVWHGILGRCTNPNNKDWPRYGGRGIGVCDEWRISFESFFAHVGPRPSVRHSIDRVDNSRGYEPGNVRWATPSEQARNRRSTRLIEHRGLTLTLSEWADRVGLSATALGRRLDKGWSVEEALSAPRADSRSGPKLRCKRGHDLIGDAVRVLAHPDGHKYRACIQCQREASRRCYERSLKREEREGC